MCWIIWRILIFYVFILIYIYIYYLIGIYIFNYIKKYSQVTCHVLYEEDLSVKWILDVILFFFLFFFFAICWQYIGSRLWLNRTINCTNVINKKIKIKRLKRHNKKERTIAGEILHFTHTYKTLILYLYPKGKYILWGSRLNFSGCYL